MQSSFDVFVLFFRTNVKPIEQYSGVCMIRVSDILGTQPLASVKIASIKIDEKTMFKDCLPSSLPPGTQWSLVA